MTNTAKPPPPLVFFLGLVIAVGIFVCFMDSPGPIIGFSMIGVGICGLILRRILAKPEHHTPLHTAGSDHGTHKRK